MMPSRGFAITRAWIPRNPQHQCRNLSSIPRPRPQTTSHRTSSIARPSRPWATSPPVFVPTIAAIRYASTTPNSPPSPAPTIPTASPPPSENAAFSNLDTITLDNVNLESPLDISGIPEGIGYLKEIGIDYGMGPTSVLQWVLEHAHISAGLPWWGSIIATAVLFRVVMIPFFLKSSDIMARSNALVSVTKPITDRMTRAQKEGNTQEVMLAYKQLSTIRKRAGISLPQQFLPMILQGIGGYCGFKLMRACATLPVPGFTDGGFLWLRDLTMTDGYLLMPLIMAGTIHVIVRWGGESGGANPDVFPPALKKFMLWGMPGMVALITAWQPGAVCVWFSSTGLLGMLQAQALQRPAVRNALGLAPMFKPKPGDGATNFLTALLVDKNKEISTRSQPAAADAASSGASSQTQPTYQAPNLNRPKDNMIIDTTLVTPQASGASPIPKAGIFDGVKDTFAKAKTIAKRRTQQTPEQLKKAEKEAYQRRAAAYEKNAQRRKR